MTRVLLVGFTPEAAPTDGSPEAIESLRARITAGHDAVRAAGYEVVHGWVGVDHEAGLAALRDTLTSQAVDVVMIGNGVRGAPEHTELFEKLVNTVHELAPRARFAFNSVPGDTLDALRRNSPPPLSRP